MPTVELLPISPSRAEETLPRLRTFVSPLTGVIRSVGETLAAPDEHRLVSIGCELADGGPTIAESLDGYTGSEHWRREVAEAAAMGEAIERYSGSFVPAERLVVATSEEFGRRAVDPERFALFSDAQYENRALSVRRFRRDTPVSWVDGFALPGGEPVSISRRSSSTCPGGGELTGEARIGYATSSGLACAATLEEAVLVGLFELVERDAFMLVWHNRLSLPLARVGRRSRAHPHRPAVLRADRPVVFGGRPQRIPGRPDGAGRRARAAGALGALGVGAAALRPSTWPGGKRWQRRSRSSAGCATDRSRARSDLDLPASDDQDLRRSHPPLRSSGAGAPCGLSRRQLRTRRDVRDVRPLEGRNVLEQIEAVCRRLDERALSAYAVDVTSPDVRSGGTSRRACRRTGALPARRRRRCAFSRRAADVRGGIRSRARSAPARTRRSQSRSPSLSMKPSPRSGRPRAGSSSSTARDPGSTIRPRPTTRHRRSRLRRSAARSKARGGSNRAPICSSARHVR